MKEAVKNITPLFLLLVTVCMVTFSYAAFSVKMSITGGATIAKSDLNTDIYVSGIQFTNLTNASEDYNPGYNDIEAKMRLTLNDNTSSASYEVTITNNTNNAYKISKHIIKKNSDAISVDKNALYLGRVIPANSSITISYTISNTSSTSVSDEIVIEYDFVKNTSTTPTVSYDASNDVDILTIGSDKFVVISRENGNIKALALNNLNVGNLYDNTGLHTGTISQYSYGYGLQNEDAKGNLGSGIPIIGSIMFRLNEDWGSYMTNIYDNTSALYSHVEDYENYLNTYYGVNVSASIPTIQDMNQAGCSIITNYGFLNRDTCASAPNIITNSVFWTQTSYNAKKIHVINPDKSVGVVAAHNEMQAGIKPIITISQSAVNDYQALEYSDTYTKDGNNYNVSIIEINGEKFYKLREDGDTVIALAMHNLDVSNNKQYNDDSSIGAVAYSNSVYWGTQGQDGFELYPQYGSSLPYYVFDNNSSIYNPLTAYANKINSRAPNVTVRLMGWNDFVNFASYNNPPLDTNRPYLYSTSYWTGIAETENQIIYVNSSNTGSGPLIYSDSTTAGIRPVIEINKSLIQARD